MVGETSDTLLRLPVKVCVCECVYSSAHLVEDIRHYRLLAVLSGGGVLVTVLPLF